MDKGFLSAAGLTKGGGEVETDRDRDTQRETDTETERGGERGNIPRARDPVVFWPL